MAGIAGRYGSYQGNYPASYAPTMNGYGMQGYGWPGMQQAGQAMQPVVNTPQMTLPTVHADILQVEDEAAMELQPVNAGTSQMMISKDETVIGVKSVLANGESTLDIYRKQPKAAKPAEPDYITREEFESRIAAMIRAAEPVREICNEPETGAETEPVPIRRTAARTTGGAKEK